MLCEGIMELEMRKMSRSYSELIKLNSYDKRLRYLMCNGDVGIKTFDADRCFNQMFYHSNEWRRVRRDVMIRDNGCDLGIPNLGIYGRIYVHHINPITMDDLRRSSNKLFSLDNLICCSRDTHEAIHYGRIRDIEGYVRRLPNDTAPWKK